MNIEKGDRLVVAHWEDVTHRKDVAENFFREYGGTVVTVVDVSSTRAQFLMRNGETATVRLNRCSWVFTQKLSEREELDLILEELRGDT